ncbi:MAG: MerR family transcriptional regulator [Cytophagales bacterium]|nr:MerR family transcriptional regulator [Rhizobacter sp.]
MSDARPPAASGQVIEEESGFTLLELCQACGAAPDEVSIWVLEGVIEPVGLGPHDWCFAGSALRRARLAMRLARDLEVNATGVALALDLLDEIAALRARLNQVQPG